MLGLSPWKLSYPLCHARIEVTVCDPELGPPKPNRANRLLLTFLSLEPWKMSFVAFNPPVYAVRADSRLVSLHSLFPFIRIPLVPGRIRVVWKHFRALAAREALSFSSANGCGPDTPCTFTLDISKGVHRLFKSQHSKGGKK